MTGVLALLLLLVILPVTAAIFSAKSILPRGLSKRALTIGAPVVYQREEVSTHPSVDAHHVQPSERGEFYYYSLINYLRVTEVLGDGRIVAVGRDNTRFCLWPHNSQLRRAHLTERLFRRRLFPHL